MPVACSSCVGLLAWIWLPGHVGDPGNEMADVVANMGRVSPQSLWPAGSVAAGGCDASWCGAAAGVRSSPLLTTTVGDDGCSLPLQGPLPAPLARQGPDAADRACSQAFWDELLAKQDPAEAVKDQQSSLQDAGRMTTIRFATANVLTLRPAEDSEHGFSTRRRQLEKGFDECRLDAIGIQEARGRHDALREGEVFFMAASAATRGGDCGCELWLRRDLCPKAAAGIFVLHSEPRRLIVKVCTSVGPLRFCVLHALGQPATDEEIAQWWDSTAELCASLAPEVPIVVLVDANARVGSLGSPAIGAKQAEEQDEPGGSFHEFLLGAGLALPATFFGADGDGMTWQSNYGYRSRLDFVACPGVWLGSVVLAAVLPPSLLALEDRVDHQAAFVEIQFASLSSGVGLQRHHRKWHQRDALKLPEVRAKIQAAWSKVP